MSYNPDKHHRRSIRLKGFDYSSAGAYFVTICTQNKECFFGDIADGKMNRNDAGNMIDKWWNELKERFVGIELDEYVIMPNHFHGIIIVGATLVVAQNENGMKMKRAGTRPAPTREKSIGNIIGAFKSITTDEYINGVKQNGWRSFNSKLWQRNYYEHIIRNEDSLNSIRGYINNNPAEWDSDELNPLVNRRGNPCGCPK